MSLLRNRLRAPDILVVPGVYDALTALMAERAQFEALYLSGAAIAYSRLGGPDIGLVSMREVADAVAVVTERTDLPLIVDGDTGFGNALNAQRAVRLFSRLGAAAMQIEDQTMPKRCGHLDQKSLVTQAEMVGKIRACTDARPSDDFLIIARTDAIAVEGFDRALDRADAYVEAGADVLFVEALSSEAEMREVCARFEGRVPLMANMVEGGRTPLKSASELNAIGFDLVIFPGGAVRVIARQLQDYYRMLSETGTSAGLSGRMLNFQELNELLETKAILARGKTYADG